MSLIVGTQNTMKILNYLFVEINPLAKAQIDLPNLLIGALFGGIVGYYLVKIIEWSHRVKLKFLGFKIEQTNFGKLLKLRFILKGRFEPGVCCCEIITEDGHRYAKWDETPNPLKGNNLNTFVPEMVPATFYQSLYLKKEYSIPILIEYNEKRINVFNGWWFGKYEGYAGFAELGNSDSVKIIIRGNGFIWKQKFTVEKMYKYLTHNNPLSSNVL